MAAKEEAGIAALICLVCFLGLTPGRMVFAAQVNHSQVKESSGTTWCIVKPSTSAAQLDNIIGFCCSEGGVDCSLIQPGGACYHPDPSKISDASVVMNIYYNIHGKTTTNCYFGGSGLTVTTDPSVDKCIYRA